MTMMEILVGSVTINLFAKFRCRYVKIETGNQDPSEMSRIRFKYNRYGTEIPFFVIRLFVNILPFFL